MVGAMSDAPINGLDSIRGPSDGLVTCRQLADKLGVHWHTVERWIKHGVNGIRLHAMAIGVLLYIDPADFAEWQRLVTEAKLGTQQPAASQAKPKTRPESWAILRKYKIVD